jgi:CcmD family protein
MKARGSLRGTLIRILAAGILALALPAFVLAQSGLPDPEAIAGQNLRGYTHMFIAYALAWAVILGWVVSIARRLNKVERALKE